MDNIKNLDLSEEEMSKISKEARERKFRIKDEKFLYSEKIEDNISCFIKSYRFLINLSNGLLRTNKKISQKIKDYLKQFEDIFFKCIEIEYDLSKDIEYGKARVKRKANKIINKNYNLFQTLIDDVYPLGRIIKEYDPSDAVAQY
ncbi:MAG: hypothetical protein ACOCV1_01535 [Bacillota bacterium]